MLLEKLLHLLADGQVHSGAQLGQSLGVSRSAVWKTMAQLESLGLQVFSAQSKGYCLSRSLELLDERRIRTLLSQQFAATEAVPEVGVFLSLDSTNAYLHQQLAVNPHGNCQFCFAEHQSAGRGRRGREWISPFGTNLYFSMLRRFSNGYAALQGLSLALGVMVAEVLLRRHITGLSLKWPNDILVDGQKLAGILVELSGEHDGPVDVIIGVGLNLQLDERDRQKITQRAIALNEVASTPFSRNELAADLIVALVRGLDLFEKLRFGAFRSRWNALDHLLDKSVSITGNTILASGMYRGVDASGCALVEGGGTVHALAGGEITLRVSDADASV